MKQIWDFIHGRDHLSGTLRYAELKPESLLLTLEKLHQRISERFPQSGLSQVAAELNEVAASIVQLTERLRNPVWPIRGLVVAGVILLFSVAIGLLWLTLQLSPAVENGLSELLQGIESGINEMIFLALALYFLATLEGRYKQMLALRSLHRLRSIAHVIDMHQLTKDPAVVLADQVDTASSPQRTLTPFLLTRYLDYCSEMLSIVGKLAALHVQHFDHPNVLDGVTNVESITGSLSAKIWQKIMILDLSLSPEDVKSVSNIEEK